MKKFIAITFILLYSMTSFVNASLQDPIDLILDQIILSNDKNKDFNENVANKTSDKHMVIESYKKNKDQNKNVQLMDINDINVSENIKIHAFASMKQSEFYTSYEKLNSLDSFIDSDNAIISTYRDTNLNYISSILFIKSKDGWKSVSQGEFILSTETIKFLSDKSKLKSLFNELGIKNPSDIKVVVGISGVDGVIYLKENNKEIIIPLSDGIKYDGENIDVCKGFTPYLVKDFFNARKNSDLNIEKLYKKMYEDPNENIVYGSEDSINYEKLKALNLSTSNTPQIKVNSNINILYALFGISLISVGLLFLKFCKKSTQL